MSIPLVIVFISQTTKKNMSKADQLIFTGFRFRRHLIELVPFFTFFKMVFLGGDIDSLRKILVVLECFSKEN